MMRPREEGEITLGGFERVSGAKYLFLQYIKEKMKRCVCVAVSSYLINGVPSRRAWFRGETCR